MNWRTEWENKSDSDGSYAIAVALLNVASALRALGNADAATPMGAMEALGAHIGEKMDDLTTAINGLSEPLRSDHPLQGETLGGVTDALSQIAAAISEAKT